MSETIKVLTIWQPWPWLIARGYKDVENRSWRTRYRGTVLIHVAQRWRKAEMEQTLDELVRRRMLPASARPGLDELRRQLGMIIARVELTGCEPAARSKSRWANQDGRGFVFELAHAEELDEPIPMTGQRGLVNAPPEVVRRLGAP